MTSCRKPFFLFGSVTSKLGNSARLCLLTDRAPKGDSPPPPPPAADRDRRRPRRAVTYWQTTTFASNNVTNFYQMKVIGAEGTHLQGFQIVCSERINSQLASRVIKGEHLSLRHRRRVTV
ncbi:hypothetical protein FKM82_003729 [Ascaphus truei]